MYCFSLSLAQGKPLVLTADEFAKLTSQGVLKLQQATSSSALTSTSNSTTCKPACTATTHTVFPSTVTTSILHMIYCKLIAHMDLAHMRTCICTCT